MCIKPHSQEKSYCGVQCVQDLKEAEEVVSSISSLRCGGFERLEWKSHATIFRFTNNLTQGSIHAKCRKKRYSIDTRKSAFQLKCHCNDKGRPEINFTPKVVAPSQRTGQPALINKKLCFLKNSGLEVIMQLVLLLPLSHLVSGKKRNHDVSPDSEKTPYSKASIFYYTKKTFKRPFVCMK